jgi:membrane protease YdiL (CAAX protease family)
VNKVRVLGESVLLVVMTIIIQVMMTIFSSIYFTLKLRNSQDTVNQKDLLMLITENNLIIILIGWIVTLLIIYIVMLLSKQNMIKIIKLDNKISLLHIGICIISAIGLNMAINGLISMSQITNLFPEYEEVISGIINHDFYLTLLCVGILIPISEEILYRGILLNKLRNGFSISIAIIIQGILFGISHMNFIQGMYAFIIGAFFGYIVIWTGSLLSSIIMHIVVNSMSVIISNTNQLNMGYNNMLILTLVGIIISIISMRILYLDRKEVNNIINFYS